MILRLLVPASILAMFLCEAALIAGSYLGALYLIRGLDPYNFLINESGWEAVAAVEAMILLGMYFRQLYSELRIRSQILLFQELILVMGVVFIAESLTTYLRLSWALPRNILLPGSAIALITLYVWRLLFSAAIRDRLGLQKVLFVGFSPAAATVAGYLEKHPEAGYAPVGYLDWCEAASGHGLGRMGSPEQLQDVIDLQRPDWIVVSEGKAISASQADGLIELRFGGVRIEDVGGFGERTTGRVDATTVKPSELIFSEDLLPNPLSLRFQAIYSTVAALLALPILIPILCVTALVIRIRSSGPILIRERRVGQFSAIYTSWRFRPAGPDHGSNGSLLHRLPQIWNVVRGEMSLVGPEADVPAFAERLSQAIPFYPQRLLVRPGLIGWAQIQKTNGESHDVVRRLEYDLYYIKNLSPVLDLFIILRWLREAIVLREVDRP